ncbi:YceD family protein [Sphingomonas sp. NCPPB 2930]|uniref:YceD family protein n=1 Tax=Sphingomonas sp. NCPPB 2930 TaxID=3162788 RepID=UPI0036D9B13E
MTPEWSRPEKIDTIGEREKTVTIQASEEERRALAGRFGLVSIDALAADLVVRRDAMGILVTGTVRAKVAQPCSVTGDPVPATVDEPVALRFVEPSGHGGDEEIELSEDSLDTIEIEGGTIDLGEAAAETMALSLDPFPRSPHAAAALKEAGVISEDEAGPFGALAGLKAKLEGKE